MKFGGSSLANAEKFLAVSAIIEFQTPPVAVVLSAPNKLTDQLENIIQLAIKNKSFELTLDKIFNELKEIVKNIGNTQTKFDVQIVFNILIKELEQLTLKLKGIKLLRQCPDNIQAQCLIIGERLSVAIMKQILLAQQTVKENKKIKVIDPCDYFNANSNFLNAKINIENSRKNFSNLVIKDADVWLMAGFSAADKNNKIVTLGRNGSDYSATCLAACLQARSCEIWTDVSGVYTVDPKLIKDAQLLEHLSYAETLELSYFGASILHPKTIEPIASSKILCRIKNTSKPKNKGTEISDRAIELNKTQKVSAISILNDLSLCTLSGSAMKGMVGMASRLFGAISRAGISLILITQSSSEYSISFCISSDQFELALESLELEFELEMSSGLIEPVECCHQVSIISLIGDHMKKHPGIAANLFQSLAHANINIKAIAQGSSERSISAVIAQKNCNKALLAAHSRFFDCRQIIEVFLIGCGNVGSGLLSQIYQQTDYLCGRLIQIKVCGISTSQHHCLDESGIALANWETRLNRSNGPLTKNTLIKLSKQSSLINPVVIDCTSSEQFVSHYIELMESGFHIVTPNKKANTGGMSFYKQLRQTSLQSKRSFLYDTNVGAGLPVIENLQKLLSAGDCLEKFEGVLSGSLSYIFGLLDDGTSLSEATNIAAQKCFTEPDPRDDLLGTDVARKILIIARETGLSLELENIKVEPVLPPDFDCSGSVDEFLSNLSKTDSWMQSRIKKAHSENRRLRYVARFERQQCIVAIQEVDQVHPLFSVKGGENALAFYTQYYQPIPLVLRGYGAGVSVTAAGIFADVLRTLGLYKEV